MEKGFNDDELADIMNEIESLEKEFTEEVTASTDEAVVEEVKEEPVAETVEATVAEADESLEEVVAEIADEATMQQVEATTEEVTEVVEEPIAETTVAEEPRMHVVEEVEPVEAAPVAEATQPVEVDEEMEEVLSELADMPVDEVVAKHEPADDNVHHMPARTQTSATAPVSAPATTGGRSAMSFTVEGDMKLDLSFNISGKVVQLNISEHGFELELDGGMKFSIPIDEVNSGKKAA